MPLVHEAHALAVGLEECADEAILRALVQHHHVAVPVDIEPGRLHAQQLSERGGELFCEDRGQRVSIAGRAVTYLEGEIRL